MKKQKRTRLAWAGFLTVLVAAGSLVAQDGDPIAQKTKLMGEALKAREEGNLQGAREKFAKILEIDSKDEGASEGLASVQAAIAAAEAAQAKANAPAAPATPATPVAPVVPSKPATLLDQVANEHASLYAEVDQAIGVAQGEAEKGNYKRALEILDSAASALPNNTAAQKSRESIALAKQEINLRREAGEQPVDDQAREEVVRLAKANAIKLKEAGDLIDKAESSTRRGTLPDLEEADGYLDKASKVLPTNIAAKPSVDRIKQVRAQIISRRAFLAIDAREMNKAESYVRDYEKLMGADEPSSKKLRAEYVRYKSDPAYRSVEEISPGLKAKDDKVQELLVKGRARYLYGDYQGALEAYREILQYQPNNAEAKAYQVRIRQILSDNSGAWNRGVTKGKLMELLDESWKLPEVFNRETTTVTGTIAADPVIEKMRSITIPEINIRDLPFNRAIDQLVIVSQSYDKDGKGVNMVVIDPDRKNPAVNMTLRTVSLEKALEIITKQANFTFNINQGIVEIRPDSGSNDLETEFFPLSTSAVIKMTGISAGGAAPAAGAAPAGGANPFGGAAASGATAGGSERPEESGIKNFFTRSGVSFETQGASLAYDGTNLIVTQTRKNLDRVRNILRRYSDIKQVHIEAKFIEVSEQSLNEFTANWMLSQTSVGANGQPVTTVRAQTSLRSMSETFGTSSVAQNGQISRQLTTTSTNATTGAVTQTTTNQTLSIPNQPPAIGSQNYGTTEPNFGGSNGWMGATGTYNGKVGTIGSYDLSIFLKALEQNNGTDLMSAPSLTVLDGKTAIIKIAQLLRYPQSYGDTQSNVGQAAAAGVAGGTTGGGVTITAGTPQDFTVQEVGVTLEVTPTVAADDSIALNLKPKVVEFEGFVEYGGTSVAISGTTTVTIPSGFFQPIFNIREVSTDVTVFDGATVVIGGLTREQVQTVQDKVPILGDIPLVGSAFRSNGKSTDKKNLMIFVTANLVSPGGATLRSSHPGMRAGSTFSNPVLISPGGAVYREPIEASTAPGATATAPKGEPAAPAPEAK
jgi:general secretion pathway protein D